MLLFGVTYRPIYKLVCCPKSKFIHQLPNNHQEANKQQVTQMPAAAAAAAGVGYRWQNSD